MSVYLQYICPDTGRIPKVSRRTLSISPNPLITPAKADESCHTLTPEGLLSELNALTGYSLLIEEHNLRPGLELLISRHHDFGTAYAWYRTAFYFDLTDQRGLDPVFTPRYAGLPDLRHSDNSLTTAETPDPDAVDTRVTKIIGNSLEGQRISQPGKSHPRRLWDIVAHRVVPFDWHARRTRVPKCYTIYYHDHPSDTIRIAGVSFEKLEQEPFGQYTHFVALSHSWQRDLVYHILSVNKCQWPVPLPIGVTINSIRDQLVCFRKRQTPFFEPCSAPSGDGFEYCWLDILCLRQTWVDRHGESLVQEKPRGYGLQEMHPPHSHLEELRLTEWKIDVPTIGGIYQRAAHVLIYPNGIGKPVSLNKKDWKSPHHWLNRAWTLQEYVSFFSPYGEPTIVDADVREGKSLPLKRSRSLERLIRKEYKAGRTAVDIRRAESAAHRPLVRPVGLFEVDGFNTIIQAIASRDCSNEVDKVAGICYLLGEGAFQELPVYHPSENVEQAWIRLINTLSYEYKWALAVKLPLPPNQLVPTWRELMEYGRSVSTTQKQVRMGASMLNPSMAFIGPVGFPCKISPIGNSAIRVEFLLKQMEDSVKLRSMVGRNPSTILQCRSLVPNTSSTAEYVLIPCIRQHADGVTDYFKQKFLQEMYCLIGEVCDDAADGMKGIYIKKIGCFQTKHDAWEGYDENIRIVEDLFKGVYELREAELRDITTLSPDAMVAKYGNRKIYSIVLGHNCKYPAHEQATNKEQKGFWRSILKTLFTSRKN